MKKLFIFAVALISALCFTSCENNENGLGTSNEPIPTSYWGGTLADGHLFYVGIEQLSEDDKNDLPSKLKKCTNEFNGYIILPEDYLHIRSQYNGFAYQEKNQIITKGGFSQTGSYGVHLPEIYEYDGNSMSCTLETGETVQLTEITKADYDAIVDKAY